MTLLSKLIRAVAVLLLSTPFASAQTSIAPPLHTSGTQILDNHNHPVQLRSVNWYGFDQKDFVAGGLDHASLDTIADLIVSMGFNSVPAMDPQKDEIARKCGDVVLNLLKKDISPYDILTHEAFENAIAAVAATGGSTNAVLHLLAISYGAQ